MNEGQDSHYTEEDSREVKKAYYESLRKFPEKANRFRVVTDQEFRRLRLAGEDMKKYRTWSDIQKIARTTEMERMKQERHHGQVHQKGRNVKEWIES